MKSILSIILTLVIVALPAGALAQSTSRPAETPSAEPKAAEPAPLVRPAEGLLFVGDEDNEPFSYLDRQGEPAGFDVEVIKLLARKTGKTITVRLLPRQAALEAARSGKADGVIGLGIPTGDERTRMEWHWCGPTVMTDYMICVRQDNSSATDLRSLDGLRVGVLAKDQELVQTLFANNSSVTTVPLEDVYKACLWVDVRRVAALVADRNAVQYFARQRSEQLKLKFVGVPVFRLNNYGPAVPIQGDEKLAGELRSAVKQLDNDGTLAQLRSEWFAFELNPTPVLEQPWVRGSLIGAGSLALLALVALTWRWQLGASIERRTRKLSAEMEVLRKHVADLQGRPDEASRAAAEVPELTSASRTLPVELNELVRELAEPLKELAGPAVALAVNCGEGLPMVDADAPRVRTCLQNLVPNARDAIAERRRTDAAHPARLWITTRLGKSEELPPAKKGSRQTFVAVSVRDTGCGLAQAEVQKIFEAGYTTKPGAAGQGLKVVYDTIAQHGGWIDVESAPGRGANFTLFLPAAEV